MTLLTDIAIPIVQFLGLIGLVAGIATVSRGRKAVGDANKKTIDRHELECKRERSDNAARIRLLEDRALRLELGKQDKQT